MEECSTMQEVLKFSALGIGAPYADRLLWSATTAALAGIGTPAGQGFLPKSPING